MPLAETPWAADEEEPHPSEYGVGHVPIYLPGRARELGQTVVQELAFRTPAVVGRLRQIGCQYLVPDLADDCLHLTAQRRREVDLNASPRSAVPHMAVWHDGVEHLLETQPLRAQLEVRGHSMPDTRLVFDRTDRSIVYFDCVGAARQSQSLGPERNGAKHLPPPFTAMLAAVDPAMRAHALHGVDVVAPDTVAMDQGALARAVRKVL